MRCDAMRRTAELERQSPGVRAVLFDMDGTLGDTIPCCVGVQCACLSRLLGRTVAFAEVAQGFGLSEEGCIRLICPDRVEEAMRSYVAQLRQEHAARCPAAFPGIPALLAALRAQGMRLGLISGRCLETLEITLAQFGLSEAFDDVRGGDAWREIKDVCAREMLEGFGVPPEEAVYIGDSPADITFSQALGMHTIAVCYAPQADREALLRTDPEQLCDTVSALSDAIFDLIYGKNRQESEK